MNYNKETVRAYWEEAPCGENLYLRASSKADYGAHAQARYKLEPFILPFADFTRYRGKKVLEIGVGLGADHQKFAEAGAILTGIDLTDQAIEHTRRRFELLGLSSDLQVADAESLSFDDGSFDMVYTWGVLHHTPDTAKALREIFRVLRRGGVAKIMIYHKYSFVGFMLWFRYAFLKLKPASSLAKIYSRYLESPGTKAYSVREARELLKEFRNIEIQIVLTHADLLNSLVGQQHQGFFLNVARLIWPRWVIRTFFSNCGLFMLIDATK